MATLIRKLPIKYPGAVAGNYVPPQTEIEIFQDPKILNWWRAEDGFSTTGWECRKTGFSLIPANVVVPNKIVSAAFNNKPVLQFGVSSNNGTLYSGTTPLLPVGSDFSIVTVVSNAGSDNAYLIANGTAATASSSFYLQLGSALSASFKMGTRSVSSSAGLTPLAPAANPHIVTCSLNDTDNTATIRFDGGLTTYTTGSATDSNTNGILYVGAGITATGAITGAFENGFLAEVFVVGAALHSTANTSLRDKVENYLKARYGIA